MEPQRTWRPSSYVASDPTHAPESPGEDGWAPHNQLGHIRTEARKSSVPNAHDQGIGAPPQALGDRCAELKTSAELARAFAGMVRRRQAGEWEDWMTKAQAPGVARELCGFAVGLRQDEAAVRAALSPEWSNGPVEGHVNRLKLLKRRMYGRAGFELLHRRFLEAG